MKFFKVELASAQCELYSKLTASRASRSVSCDLSSSCSWIGDERQCNKDENEGVKFKPGDRARARALAGHVTRALSRDV